MKGQLLITDLCQLVCVSIESLGTSDISSSIGTMVFISTNVPDTNLTGTDFEAHTGHHHRTPQSLILGNYYRAILIASRSAFSRKSIAKGNPKNESIFMYNSLALGLAVVLRPLSRKL